MSLLRIHVSLREGPRHCDWSLISEGREPHVGSGPPEQLPQRAQRIQLVLPAADVLITRSRLPQSARRQSGAVLAFAVEEQTLGDPDTHQVTWLGSAGGADVLAVLDRTRLAPWQEALEAAGIRGYSIHCETLMLPWMPGEWSLAWDGREGFVRTGEFEGAGTDFAEPGSPPLSLRMMLDDAKSRGEAPASIALYATAPDSLPDLEPWQRALGVALRPAGSWNWRSAPADAGVSLAQEQARWRLAPATLARLRPAAWIAGAALAIHAIALVVDWTRLALDQRSLRAQMENSFRANFPDTVSVVDPALQMRRKLVEARRAVGQPDGSDFLPMVTIVAEAVKGLPAGGLRVLSYESGRMTLELAVLDEAGSRRLVARLLESGLRAETSRGATGSGGSATILTVRTS